MKFTEIEALIGDRLPPSARKHRAWWSNNPSNSVITYAWLEAGYQSADVDMAAHKLTFRRARVATPPSGSPGGAPPPRNGPHPVWSSPLRGSVKIAEGVDLTAPLWDVADDEA
jgi:hypothetical protein